MLTQGRIPHIYSQTLTLAPPPLSLHLPFPATSSLLRGRIPTITATCHPWHPENMSDTTLTMTMGTPAWCRGLLDSVSMLDAQAGTRSCRALAPSTLKYCLSIHWMDMRCVLYIISHRVYFCIAELAKYLNLGAVTMTKFYGSEKLQRGIMVYIINNVGKTTTILYKELH
jgi:hypothetical protein